MKGLAFIPEMAVAACEGRKTNTRRVMVPQPKFDGLFWNWDLPRFRDTTNISVAWGAGVPIEVSQPWDYCEYRAGERRCLLTTWATRQCWDNLKPSELPANAEIWHAGMGSADAWKVDRLGVRRPGRFLPNALRHLMPVFEIVSVRAERVQAASEHDIVAEGVRYPINKVSETQGAPLLRITGPYPPANYLPRRPRSKLVDQSKINHVTLLRAHWASLWDSINHKRGFGWETNCWVWVVAFRRVTA